MLKTKAHKLMSKIVGFIRDYCQEHDGVAFARVAYECEIAPSTLYGYIGMITDLYPDIQYKNKLFFIIGISIDIERERRNTSDIHQAG